MADESKDPLKLQFKKKPIVGPIFEEELDELVDDLKEKGFSVDKNYLDRLEEIHGRTPVARFFNNGQIEQFLNLVDSYYNCTKLQRESNVNVVRGWFRKRNVRKTLVPFASMPGGSYLCFDYSVAGSPRIVIWGSEGHNDEDEVAPDFLSFLQMLSQSPK